MTALDTAQAQQITEPLFLIELFFNSVTLRYSTRQTVTYNGNQYMGNSGAQVNGINALPGGGMQADIELTNFDRTISALVLNEKIQYVGVKIRKGYGSGATLAADVVMPRFIGVISEIPSIGETVVIRCRADNINTQFSPRTLIGPPVFNHIPKAGTIITWGGESYELTRG